MSTYLCVYLGSLALACLTTPAVIWLAGRIGALDRPGVRKVHERPVPRLGGAAIFVSALCPIVAVILWHEYRDAVLPATRLLLIILLGGATIVFAVGLADDLKGLPARIKLLAELLTAAGVCLLGVRIPEVTFSEGWSLPLGNWSYVVTILWLVGITNAVNLSDGLDGLAAGIGIITCSGLALYAWHSGNMTMSVLMLALAGSLGGFLTFNFYPARIFMGDSGSLFLGFMIAVSSVACMMKSTAFVGLALPALALGIPICDTLCAILRRLLERRSLFAPDRSHFHHRLLERGLSHRRAVLLIYLLTLVTTGLGLSLLVSAGWFHGLLVCGGVGLLVVLVFRGVGVVPLHQTRACLRRRRLFARHQRDERRVFEDSQLQLRQVRDAGEWWQTVCQAARRMDFAWVSLKTRAADGRIEEEIWRTSRTPPDPAGLVILHVPLHSRTAGRQASLELALAPDGSLETTSRRATLFARLLEENEMWLTTAGNS
jgi:UDP-GlcNAc:undecaprenyl-phosphate GlcNAc-1-phosphate transferase